MDARTKRSDRLDQLDRERFGDMLASPPFAILRGRIEAELERARGDCERQADQKDIHRAQGAAAALRVVLGLPQKILDEISAERK